MERRYLPIAETFNDPPPEKKPIPDPVKVATDKKEEKK